MRLDKFFIGTIILLVFLTGGSLIIGEQSTKYDIDINTSSEKAFPKTSEYIASLQNSTSTLREPLEREEEFNPESMFGFLLEAGLEVITLTWDLLKVPVGLARDFYALLEIPPSLTVFFTIGLVVIFIFTFVYLYFRFQPR